jgi:molybdopterin synthase catalytic subunit
VAASVAAEHDDVVAVAAVHRTGRLEVGDLAVVIAVASPHRAEAFEVCRALIETIKTDLPVWKRQVEADGTTAWKGLGG